MFSALPLRSAPRFLLAGAVVMTLASGCGSNGSVADPTASTPTGAATTSSPIASRTTTTVDVSLADCGSTWVPVGGLQRIALHNAGTAPGEVRILERNGPTPGGVLLDVEPFGPGTTVTRTVRLGAGRYSLECLMEDAPIVVGPTLTVTGSQPGGPAVVPVDSAKLTAAAETYRRWVANRLPGLLGLTRSLQSAIERHDLADARATWLRAHAAYETLGAAYDAFGDLDTAINGIPAGGFHTVEAGLWSGRPAWPSLVRGSAGLSRDVAALRHRIATTGIDALTFSIRAHEISENLLQSTLTGHDDLGSHSALSTLSAGLSGTSQVLGMVRPLLRVRYAALPTLERQLWADRALVSRLGGGRLGHLAVADWPVRQRELVSAQLSRLTELLAPVADVLEPRRTS